MRKRLSLEEKIALIDRTRSENFKASLKLEGFKTSFDFSSDLTKEELIKKHKQGPTFS